MWFRIRGLGVLGFRVCLSGFRKALCILEFVQPSTREQAGDL